jgi:hypothetical protein
LETNLNENGIQNAINGILETNITGNGIENSIYGICKLILSDTEFKMQLMAFGNQSYRKLNSKYNSWHLKTNLTGN